MSDDAGWQFMGSAKEASDRAAKLGHQNEGIMRSYSQGPADNGGGTGLLGTLLSIFAFLLLQALKLVGHLLLWTLNVMFARGRCRRR